VTVSADGTLRLWEWERGRTVEVPLQGSGEVDAVRFSDDGRLLLAVGSLRVAQVDVATGRVSRTWDRPEAVARVDVLTRRVYRTWDWPDLPASGGRDRRWSWPIWSGGRLAERFQDDRLAVEETADPFVKQLLTTGRGRTVEVEDRTSTPPRRIVLSHPSEVLQVVFSHDKRLILTASYEGVARLWDAATDVFGLGAVLCEVLTGWRLTRRSDSGTWRPAGNCSASSGTQGG